MKTDKRITSILLIFLITVAIIVPYVNKVSAEAYSGYIMGYFKQETGEYGLNLCYSTDGFNWKNINNGKPVLYANLGTKGIRDPFIYRKPDGGFIVTATDMLGTNWGDQSQYIHFWESPDLINFKERLLKVHSAAMHAWAPEVVYDSSKKQYAIYWSGNTNYNRTYVNYTTDFNSLTANQVFFDPGYDVIDSHIIQNNGTSYLFFKDERSSGKSIKAAKATSLNPGSFSVYTSGFITSAGTEGPFVFKDNNSDTWYLYADLYGQNGKFECWKTTDLNSTNWTKVTNISVPAGVRHGSVVSVTQTELDSIIAGRILPTPTPIDYSKAACYKVVNENSGKVLDVEGASLNDGAGVIQQSDNDGPGQKWYFIDTDSGYKKIINSNSKKFLDVSEESVADGGNVIQWKNTEGYNQQWKLMDNGNGYYKIICRKSSKLLEVSGQSTDNGAKIDQWSDNGGKNQHWKLVPIGSATPVPVYKVSGYISPDFSITAAGSAKVKEGFKVELLTDGKYAITDQYGHFEISGVSGKSQTLRITKENYLFRETNIVTGNNVEIGSVSSPVVMWAGDIAKNGIQDNAINMSDIMEVAASFNTAAGNDKYKEGLDLNRDGAINMSDIMIIANHFNRVTADYPVN